MKFNYFNSPLTIRKFAIWGTRGCCNFLEPSVGCRYKRHQGHDVLLHYFLQRTPLSVLEFQCRKLYCTVPTHPRSICQFKFSKVYFRLTKSLFCLLWWTGVCITLNDSGFRTRSVIAK